MEPFVVLFGVFATLQLAIGVSAVIISYKQYKELKDLMGGLDVLFDEYTRECDCQECDCHNED